MLAAAVTNNYKAITSRLLTLWTDAVPNIMYTSILGISSYCMYMHLPPPS